MSQDPMTTLANGTGEALKAAAAAGEAASSIISDKFTAAREQAKQSAEAARDWAARQAAAAKLTAAEKPVLVVSLSAATALAVGLALGFVLGRATAVYD